MLSEHIIRYFICLTHIGTSVYNYTIIIQNISKPTVVWASYNKENVVINLELFINIINKMQIKKIKIIVINHKLSPLSILVILVEKCLSTEF